MTSGIRLVHIFQLTVNAQICIAHGSESQIIGMHMDNVCTYKKYLYHTSKSISLQYINSLCIAIVY